MEDIMDPQETGELNVNEVAGATAERSKGGHMLIVKISDGDIAWLRDEAKANKTQVSKIIRKMIASARFANA